MIAPPVVSGGIAVRVVSLITGLFVCALAIVLMLGANLGLGPWDVLSQGISRHVDLSFGAITVAVSFARPPPSDDSCSVRRGRVHR